MRKEGKQAYCAWALMAREVRSCAPLSGAAPFLRKRRLGLGLVRHVSAVSRSRSPGNCFPQLGPGSLSSRAKRLPAFLARPHCNYVSVRSYRSTPYKGKAKKVNADGTYEIKPQTGDDS
jgi:hypothetical protein